MALDILVISVGAVLLVVILGLILIFNSLITARQKVKNAWAQIDVQLKKRADLVDNLVNVVKGYSKYEKKTLTDITERRTRVMNSKDPSQLIAESNGLASSMKSIFAVAENYPDLKANPSFLELQKQLAELENGIAYARMVYNDVVTIYNTLIMTFPQNLVSGPLGFTETKLLETDDIQRLAVGVKL
jgi:LemA protein